MDRALFTNNQCLLSKWLLKSLTIVLAILAAGALLLFMLLVSNNELLKPDTTTVREVSFSVPPPPPHPPPTRMQQPAETPSLDISVAGDGPSLATTPITLEGAIEVEDIQPPEPKAITPEWDTLLQPNWNTVGLEQLDAPPRLLVKLKIDYPAALVKQGINKVILDVDVMIDETGRVFLRQILGSPPNEIINPIKKLINKARFTAPMKDGVAVRASFIWPLEFSK